MELLTERYRQQIAGVLSCQNHADGSRRYSRPRQQAGCRMKPRGTNIMKTTERVGWLLIGAGIGAGIALLYAPVSGQETRKLIRRKAEDARDTIVETGGQVRDRVVEAGESVAETARGV